MDDNSYYRSYAAYIGRLLLLVGAVALIVVGIWAAVRWFGDGGGQTATNTDQAGETTLETLADSGGTAAEQAAGEVADDVEDVASQAANEIEEAADALIDQPAGTQTDQGQAGGAADGGEDGVVATEDGAGAAADTREQGDVAGAGDGQLPSTGPVETTAAVAGIAILFYGALQYIRSDRSLGASYRR